MAFLSRDINAASDQYLYGANGGATFGGDLDQDFTMEWWLNADAFPSSGGEVILFRGNGLSSNDLILIKIINDAGTLKLFAHIQENNDGLVPGADQHCDVEFDLSALVSSATWEYVALTMDISAVVATKFELFHGDEATTPTSQGNGTVVSGTDCSSIPSINGNVQVMGDGTSGRSFDGKVFRWAVWNDLRTLGELQTNYKTIFLTPTSQAGLVGFFWGGNEHDQDRSASENNLQSIANGGAAVFVASAPSGVVFEQAGVGANVTAGGPSGKVTNGGYRAGLTSPGPASVTAGGPSGKVTNGGYRAGLDSSEDADVWYMGATAAAAGTGTTFPPLLVDQKSQFISTEPLEIALHPFISAITGQFILGTDNASVQVVKPDNTLYATPPTLTWDSGIERWKGEIPITAFQEGEWLLYFTSDDPNAIPQWLMLWWGDYVDDVPEIRQAALGRWRIIGTQLVLYEDDLTTIFRTFDLRDSSGDPSSTNIFDKDPVP